MFNVDHFMQKKYIANEYTCYDFIREVWKELVGVDIGFLPKPRMDKDGINGEWEHVAARWRKLNALKDPCVVLFQRPRIIPHVGVYMRGKVLHLPENSNARFEDLSIARMGYPKVSFFT